MVTWSPGLSELPPASVILGLVQRQGSVSNCSQHLCSEGLDPHFVGRVGSSLVPSFALPRGTARANGRPQVRGSLTTARGVLGLTRTSGWRSLECVPLC